MGTALKNFFSLIKFFIVRFRVIDISEVIPDVNNLLMDNENIVFAFKTYRDQLIFTNKRIISIDAKGITGKRKEYVSRPYLTVEVFSIETKKGTGTVKWAEMVFEYENGSKYDYRIKGNFEVGTFEKQVANYIYR